MCNVGRFDDVYVVVGHVWNAIFSRKIHGITLGGHTMFLVETPLTATSVECCR